MSLKFVLNHAGVRELLRSKMVLADMKRRAERIAAVAGPGHEVETFVGRNRARATVRTVTDEAKIAQEAHQNLTHAIRAGE